MTTYQEKLKDPRWQKRRLEVFSRDSFTCQLCFGQTKEIQVHHLYYEKDKDPWDYPLDAFVTLCDDCHKKETAIRNETEQRLILTLRKLRFTNFDLIEMYLMLERFFGFYYYPIDIVDALQQSLLSPETFNKLLDDSKDWPL